MLLVIDVGNTDTVFGLYDHAVPTVHSAGDGLTGHWRISTHAERTADEQAVMLEGFLGLAGYSWNADVDGVAI